MEKNHCFTILSKKMFEFFYLKRKFLKIIYILKFFQLNALKNFIS